MSCLYTLVLYLDQIVLNIGLCFKRIDGFMCLCLTLGPYYKRTLYSASIFNCLVPTKRWLISVSLCGWPVSLWCFGFVETRPPKSKLECVAQYSLFGNVTSMHSVKLANAPRDALLLAFSNAKLSIVEYDPEVHTLKTISLHYFEEDEMKVCTYINTRFYLCTYFNTNTFFCFHLWSLYS